MDKQSTTGEFSDDLRTKVAWLYYMEGMTQDEISKTLGLSRSRFCGSSPIPGKAAWSRSA